jgi:hypothetical protein
MPATCARTGRDAQGHFGAVVALLAAAAAVLYARQLFFGQTFVLRDHLVYTWPERKILSDALRAGRIPEWNDLIGFGTEFASSSANGVTYPPLWLVAVFPLPWSMDAVIALHVLLAGIGTALFARRLGARTLGAALAGAAFMSCGYVASIAPNKVFIGTAWMPWIAWAADRLAGAIDRRQRVNAVAVLAGVIAAQLLAGDPAACITSALVAVTVVIARSERRREAFSWFAATYLPAALLAAAGVLPGVALLPHTTRGTLDLWDANLWSLHPWRLLEMVWPGFLGAPTDARLNLAEVVAASGKDVLEPSWSMSLFVGAPILALAVAAALDKTKRVRGLWIGAIVLVLLAMGPHTPVDAILRTIFPPERIIRYPEKHVVGAVCLICALAGAGLSEATRAARPIPWIFGLAIGLLVLPLTILSVLWPVVASWLGEAGALVVPPVDVESAMALSLRSGVVGVASATATSWLLIGSSWRSSGALAVAVHVLHAAWEGWTITPVTPVHAVASPPKLLRAAPPPGAPPPRIFRPPAMDAAVPPENQAIYRHETLLLDGAARFGYAAVPGFEGWRHRDEARLWSRAAHMPLRSFLTMFAIEAVALPSALRERVLPRNRAPPQTLLADLELASAAEPPAGDVSWTLVRTEGVRPRAFVAPRWKWAAPTAALETLVAPGRGEDPGLVVLTGEGPPSPADRNALPLSPCAIASYIPERIVLQCDSPQGGYATLLDEDAPGWTATVDGAPARIATADLLLRAVAVGPGAHRVEFTYRAPLLRTGAFLSACSWALWIAFFWRRRTSASSFPLAPAAEPATAPAVRRRAARRSG